VRLDAKRALVTGAASGIGLATAERFEAEGAQVVRVDRVEGEGGDVVADVGSEDEVEQAVAAAVARLGGLDIAVAAAGIQLHGADAPADRLELEAWERTIRTNLTGTFLTCKHAVRALLGSGGGSVVCVASPTALAGVAPGYDAYSASKAGILGLVRALARDYAPSIRVNAVVPGFIDTPLVEPVTRDAEWLANVLSTVPLNRAGTAAEVAALIAFVASDECAYATGAAFVLDGGMTA
jgi:NAD(P)-dependent dehydrogenase (short-subunit alcohol dehydrogenase family)